MNAAPKVSVVVTCYNYGRYIRHAIESVLSQTVQDFEILIVNDGSTDDSEAVIKTFLSDPRIKYILQQNRGQANAKNNGIKAASGEFVAFLDADDYWKKDKLENQLTLFANPNVGVVYGRQTFVDDSNQALKTQYKKLDVHRGRVLEFFLLDNFVPFSSSIVRRQILLDRGLFDESLSMGIDWDLWLRIAVAYEFDYVDDNVLFYRVNHSGQMSKNYRGREECSDRIFEKFMNSYADVVSPDLLRRARIYTYNNRGYFYIRVSPARALHFYVKSWLEKWNQMTVYKGFLTALVYYLFYKLSGRIASK